MKLKKRQISRQPKLKENELVSRNTINVVEEENLQLNHKSCQLKLVIKKINEEKRRMERHHKLELGWRNKKEVGLVIGVGVCAMLYVVVALTIRGFA
jgi:hypothetical protein